jgi:DNA topoisomerase-1
MEFPGIRPIACAVPPGMSKANPPRAGVSDPKIMTRPSPSSLPRGSRRPAFARQAGLRYVSDGEPGITRRQRGRAVSYWNGGRRVRAARTLARIRALAIPPAWTEVWICRSDSGHIQAVGRDLRGRKQYRYHAGWNAVRDGAKFERTIAFGRALPRIRRRVAHDLRRRSLDQRKVLAAVVRLLETTLIRVGNEEYAKQNHSFGLSTMRDRHVRIAAGTLHFRFLGKGGKVHRIDLHDPRLARVVRRAQELPGQDLFQYVDDQGATHKINSDMVNAYLRDIAGAEFSAKDFRTWAGTVLAAIALRAFARFESQTQAKKNLVAAVEEVARRLGNTPAICRKCYIHPVVMDSYLSGQTVEVVQRQARRKLRRPSTRLSPAEKAVLTFLEGRLRRSHRKQSEDAAPSPRHFLPERNESAPPRKAREKTR